VFATVTKNMQSFRGVLFVDIDKNAFFENFYKKLLANLAKA
jgi:hypothetical protein